MFDCVNHCKLLPVEDYFPGVELPPHLSPFVKEEEGDYVPPERQAMLEEQRQTGEGDSEAEEEEEGEKLAGLDLKNAKGRTIKNSRRGVCMRVRGDFSPKKNPAKETCLKKWCNRGKKNPAEK